jgi:hypothetical protein
MSKVTPVTRLTEVSYLRREIEVGEMASRKKRGDAQEETTAMIIDHFSLQVS